MNTAAPGEKFDWNNFWGSVINGVIFGAGFGAVGTYAMAVKSVAIMTALGFSSLTFAAMSAIRSIEYGQEGEYELAITYWFLTAIGLIGAARSFNQAYQFSTARTTATTTTQNTASNTSCAKGEACFIRFGCWHMRRQPKRNGVLLNYNCTYKTFLQFEYKFIQLSN